MGVRVFDESSTDTWGSPVFSPMNFLLIVVALVGTCPLLDAKHEDEEFGREYPVTSGWQSSHDHATWIDATIAPFALEGLDSGS